MFFLLCLEPTLSSVGAIQVVLGADAKLTLEFSHSLGTSPRKRRGVSPARHGRGFLCLSFSFLCRSNPRDGQIRCTAVRFANLKIDTLYSLSPLVLSGCGADCLVIRCASFLGWFSWET
ncbi:hypothetical protein CSPX01_14707 [Colletotrichum filicis]|nr:hypothetical protein CSPX01_14707 [Colletotrichum filicis]